MVVGAGIVGCATAYELARRGASVCLVDRGAVSGGTTGLGEGNVLCCDKRPGPELSLAVRGLALYDEIEELLGEEAGIRRKGALVVHAGAEGWAAEQARLDGLHAAGVRCSLLAADEVRRAEASRSCAATCWARRSSRTTCNALRARSRAGWRARRSGSARPSRPAARAVDRAERQR